MGKGNTNRIKKEVDNPESIDPQKSKTHALPSTALHSLPGGSAGRNLSQQFSPTEVKT